MGFPVSQRDRLATALAATLLLAGCASGPVASTKDVAPNGELRVAIGVGPAASPFWATRDDATGSARGVTVELLGQGRLDAIAMGRETLIEFSKRLPGTRLLSDIIQSTGVVIVVPKNRPATREWAARFVEEAKANGTVRRALDGAGFTNAAVAPPLAKR